MRRLLFNEGLDAPPPAHLEPVVAWLSLWDDEVPELAIQCMPHALVEFGDPGSLPVETRRKVLRAYANLYEGRGALFRRFSRASLVRFATPEL